MGSIQASASVAMETRLSQPRHAYGKFTSALDLVCVPKQEKVSPESRGCVCEKVKMVKGRQWWENGGEVQGLSHASCICLGMAEKGCCRVLPGIPDAKRKIVGWDYWKGGLNIKTATDRLASPKSELQHMHACRQQRVVCSVSRIDHHQLNQVQEAEAAERERERGVGAKKPQRDLPTEPEC